MNFGNVAKQVEKFTVDNSPLIMTVFGVAGTITTAVLTHRAAVRATHYIRHEQERIDLEEKSHPLDNKEKAKLTWKLYIPPVVAGVGTITAIVGANQVNNRRAAAMAAAYSISQRGFEEYREKITEKLGKTKEQTARDEIAQNHINRNPVGKNEIIITGGGEVLCYDKYTGRYFMSSMDTLKKAENEINFYVLNNGYANLNDFYRYIGLPTVPVGEEVGWTQDLTFSVDFSTTISENDKPCIVVDYHVCGVRRRPESFDRIGKTQDGHPIN